MNRRGWLIVVVAVVLAFVGGWASAQPTWPATPVTPVVISGPNVGFRVEGYSGDVAVGRLVIQVNGKWFDTDSGGIRRLSQ